MGMDPALFGAGPPAVGGRKANLSSEIQAWAEEVRGMADGSSPAAQGACLAARHPCPRSFLGLLATCPV